MKKKQTNKQMNKNNCVDPQSMENRFRFHFHLLFKLDRPFGRSPA